MLNIQKTLLPPADRKTPPPSDKLGFGEVFTDHCLVMRHTPDKGWHDAKIHPYADFNLHPAAKILHYGQGIFEGMKAYCDANKDITLFRPDKNMERLNISARRLCLPEIAPALAMDAITQLVLQDRAWIPEATGTSLYIRPYMMGIQATLGVKASKECLFCVILSPVGAYYAEGFGPTKILVTEDYARAAAGGTGNCKVIGNYAASLIAGEMAQKAGYAQVLWLDSSTRKYVEEVGAMNIFFVREGKLVTPRLNGSILPGITRDSILTLAREKGMETEERDVEIAEVIAGIESGTISECFGSGTAAVISPVSTIGFRGRDYLIGKGQNFPTSNLFFDAITSLQYGRTPDTHNWVQKIGSKRTA